MLSLLIILIKYNYGDKALIWASGRGYKNIVKLLLAIGADIDARDIYGGTALELASLSLSGYKDIAKLLLNAGADVNIKYNNGNTALKLTRNEFNINLNLIKLGASDTASKNKDWNSLMWAI